MKKLLFAVLVIAMCSSCGTTLWLTGKYNAESYSIETSKPAETVWNDIVDWFFFTQTPIELIDKESGIIISGNISLRNNYTYEINEQPGETSKYVVIPNGAMNYRDMRVYGRVQARIKAENGKTRISVFLGDLECIVGTSTYIEAKSLGTFEKKWLKYISNK